MVVYQKSRLLIIISLLTLLNFNANGQNNGKNQTIKLLVGTWGEGVSYYTDSIGNIKDRSSIRLSIGSNSSFEEPWLYDSIPYDLNFNSVFEGLNFIEGDAYGYPFRFKLNGDTLIINGNHLLIEEITQNNLLLKDIPDPNAIIDLFLEEGDSKWEKYNRINFLDKDSNGPKNSELVFGEWIIDYLLVVKTEGFAWAMEPVVIKDTLSDPIYEAKTVFNFTAQDLEMYEDGNLQKVEPLNYEITGDVIRVLGEILFTILDINDSEMTLLGIHGTDMHNGQPLMIWKLKRYFSGR